jgi:hypothetical protein
MALLVDEEELFVLYRISFTALAFILFVSASPFQQTSLSDPTQPGVAQGTEDNNPSPRESKRILFIIPNCWTSPSPGSPEVGRYSCPSNRRHPPSPWHYHVNP